MLKHELPPRLAVKIWSVLDDLKILELKVVYLTESYSDDTEEGLHEDVKKPELLIKFSMDC